MFSFRKMPIREFHLDRVLNDLGLSQDEVSPSCGPPAIFYVGHSHIHHVCHSLMSLTHAIHSHSCWSLPHWGSSLSGSCHLSPGPSVSHCHLQLFRLNTPHLPFSQVPQDHPRHHSVLVSVAMFNKSQSSSYLISDYTVLVRHCYQSL